LIALTPAGRKIVSGSDDQTIKVWDVQDDKELASFVADGWITSVVVSQDGGTIIAGEYSDQVHFLKLENLD
jgi:WD40 repeat protein